MSLDDYGVLLSAHRSRDLRDRFERVLCAFFLHARFRPGHFVLDPAVPVAEGFAGAPPAIAFEVSDDHLKLLRQTEWRCATINTKRPYGGAVTCEVDVARILGIPIPELEDHEELPIRLHRQLRALHHDLLFVLQAFLQHAELKPGKYRIPFDGWHLIRPRCKAVAPAQIKAYLAAWDRIRRQNFANASDRVVPVMRAAELLFDD